jgi:4-diphosphocytidyl-2-C-methyl-D-erythritol kinase
LDGVVRRPGNARLISSAPVFEGRPRAKVNLTLRVVGTRPDGYHELRSVFLRIGLSDRLRVSPGGGDGADTLNVTGLQGVPARRNLVMRAVEAVRARAQVPLPALDVTLNKDIPVAAGLGGGSSDCASAIKLAQAAWGVAFSEEEERAIGASLGADVPFFLSGAEMALVEGIGERVTPMRPMGSAGLLIVTQALELSTERVFQRFDEIGVEAPAGVTANLLEYPDLAAAASGLRDSNHLWLAAASLAPRLEQLRDELESASARPWLMSGSGPTLYAIYPSVAEAADSGGMLIRDRTAALADAVLSAVDLVGPDPAWRYP